MAEGLGAPTYAVNGAFWLVLKMTFCSDGTKTPLAISGFCERLLVHGWETLRMLKNVGHAIYRSALFQRDSKGNTMYDIVGEFEKKGIEKYAGIQTQCLISTLEQRFPDFPDSLKNSIRQVTDSKKLIELSFTAGAAHSLDEIARQLSV